MINAANAVIAPSEREGFGLAPLEALACDVPVLATDVGVAPLVLERRRGHAVRSVRRRERWAARARARTSPPPTRAWTAARRAALFDRNRLAERVFRAYRDVVGAP